MIQYDIKENRELKKEKLDYKQVSQLCGITNPTFYNWKSEKRPILYLLNKYFTNAELEEFIKTGSIRTMEVVNELKKREGDFFDSFVSVIEKFNKNGKIKLLAEFINFFSDGKRVFADDFPLSLNETLSSFLLDGVSEHNNEEVLKHIEFQRIMIDCGISLSDTNFIINIYRFEQDDFSILIEKLEQRHIKEFSIFLKQWYVEKYHIDIDLSGAYSSSSVLKKLKNIKV